ncbi:MAG: hypothetical protein AB8F34_12885 [Akkermansiaceae bacterium]
MNAKQLAESATSGGTPPGGISLALKALWLARAGRWHEAHDLCEDVEDPAGSWIHAHLHRVEGDLGNAGYWYDRAGKSQPEGQAGLGEEWFEIAEELSDAE